MVNFCQVERDGMFNVNVILNASGAVVATYRKTHPWFKHIFDAPASPDLVVFNGFGMFMCYDIVFRTPSITLRDQGVSKFLYNAAIPIVGSAVFRSWTLLNNSTLIAADLGDSGAYVNGDRIVVDVGKIMLAKI